jgi:hypothetical protein
MTDPFDVLRSHVRSVALLEHPDTEPDDLVAQITGVADPMPDGASVIAFPQHRSPVSPGSFRSNGSPRRRRWLVAAGVSAIVVVGGAGVAAFVGTRPSAPAAGVVCRASVSNSSAIVIEPTDTPIAACAALWARGDLPEIDRKGSGEIPRLVACVGERGVLEVLPLSAGQSCDAVGMVDADATGTGSDPVVALQELLAVRVNLAPCQSPDAVTDRVDESLREVGLASWTVEVRDPGARCAFAVAEPTRTRVLLIPRSSPTD